MIDNSSIESRYKIEYVTQNSEKRTRKSAKGWIILLSALLMLGAFAYIYNPFKSLSDKAKPTAIVNSSKTASIAVKQVETTIDVEGNSEDKFISTTTEEMDEYIALKEAEKLLAYPTDSSNLIPVSLSSNDNVKHKEKRNQRIINTHSSTEALKDELTLKKEVDSLLLKNNAQEQAAVNQLNVNENLSKKLEFLTSKLMAEKQKNENLNTQINIQENKNIALTSLLETAVKTVNIADQQYISAMNKLNATKNETTNPKSQNKNQVNINELGTDIANQKPTQTKTIDYNNSISLSTAQQVDAIVAAMQNINSTTYTTKYKKKITPAKSQESEQLFASLQKQINALIDLEKTPKTDYKKALSKESDVRNNEMRSIVVKKGETLWAISKRAYGDGLLYKKIIKANPHVFKNGKVLLLVGQVIRVPI
ncbi:MAG: LysM peptidoglycan-binding domain-containing protein [Cocleimonas sp.]